MNNVNECKLNFTDVSQEDRELIGRGFLACVEDYFKKPGVEDDFKKWQQKRNKKVFVL